MRTTTSTRPLKPGDSLASKDSVPVSAFRRFGVSAFPAFTLVEVMVVIGILAVLVTLALTAGSSVLANSRATQTKATLSVIEAAIEQFVRENPFGTNPNVQGQTLRLLKNAVDNPNKPPAKCDIRYTLSGVLNTTADDTNCTINVPLFERYPPCPTAEIAPCSDYPETFMPNCLLTIDGHGQTLPWPFPATAENDDDPQTTPSRAETQNKFLRLVNVMKAFDRCCKPPCCDPDHPPWCIQHDKQQPDEKYASIECLIFALREFSPGARAIIDKLPSKVLVNLDKDFAYWDQTDDTCTGPRDGHFQAQCPSERNSQVTLYEVLDAFPTEKYPHGQPIRYAIREAIHTSIDPGAPLPAPIRWELRSAGADGIFAPPFTEESRSDDVILQGQ